MVPKNISQPLNDCLLAFVKITIKDNMLVCWLLHRTIPKSRDVQFCVNKNASVPRDRCVSKVEGLSKVGLGVIS
jgi:hypothetical protein